MDQRRLKRHPNSKSSGHTHNYGLLDNVSLDGSDISSVDRGPLSSVIEETVNDELGAANSATTFALTTKHLMATTDTRLSYHRTQDINAYKSMCEKQRKSSSKVPSPYHTASLMGQWGKPQSKASEAGTEDTGYRSTYDSSCAGSSAYDVHLSRRRSSLESSSSKHHVERDRHGGLSSQRIPTRNPKPAADTDTLAAVLIEKLQQVQRERDLYRSREDLEKEEAQSILDDHISRVFGDSSGELSPREKVSSWVMDAKKYCDTHSDDKYRSTKMEISNEDERHYRLNPSHRLGSIDEGLGRSINSLATSRSELGRSCSTISSRESVAQLENRRFSHSTQHSAIKHETRDCASQSSSYYSNDQSRPRTNKKPSNLCPPPPSSTTSASVRETISVIYQINGESLPYLSKFPGTEITLRQFKSLVPRKGKYRYFFKRTCDDTSIGAVFEEITEDNELLPFWEGKISARLEATD